MRALTLALILSSVAATIAEDARDAIQRGNEHFQAGRYEEALAAYDQAAADADDESLRAELLHNRAAAQFKLGQIAEARELWVRAVPIRDASFEAKSRYNLGNCDYADALAALEAQDTEKALERLGVAAKQYRQAIRLDRDLTDARANLELTHRLIEQIEQNSTTQPQSQPQDQESSTQPSEDQESQSDRNTEQDDDQAQPSSRPSSQQSQPESQPSTQEQDEQSEPDESESDQQEDPTTQPAATQPSAESQPSEAGEDGLDRPPIELNLTREEAEKLLQKVRDAERARRKILRLREAAKYKPADRDW